MVITYAGGEGGARSMRACRARRSGMLSAWSQREWPRAFRVVQWLAGLEHWTWDGGGRWRASQTQLARLVRLVACCKRWGWQVCSAMVTIDGMVEFTVS